jgi:CubicO group peptidase (beta-lactamase class C family)
MGVMLEQALERVDGALLTDPAYAQTTALAVLHRGELVFERGYSGGDPDEPADLYSVTKSVVATLVGVALRRGDLDTVDRTVASCLDRDVPRPYTLRHLLTMTAGVEADGPWEIDAVMARDDSWLDHLLAAPARDEPGMAFRYDNGSAHVLACALASVVGERLDAYAQRHLFAPRGIGRFAWPHDPEGFAYGFGHLRLRPRDAAQIGELYRRGGRDLLDPGFVREATRAHSAGGGPEGRPYGFLWWIGERGFFGAGYAGQLLTVLPEQNVVAVATGSEALLRPGWRNPRSAVERGFAGP